VLLMRNLADNASSGYLDTAEMWVLAGERAAAATRTLQRAALSDAVSALTAMEGNTSDGDDDAGKVEDARRALAAAVLALSCEIELVSESSGPFYRRVMRRFCMWARVDGGSGESASAAAGAAAVDVDSHATLALELAEDLNNEGDTRRRWTVLVPAAAPDASPRAVAAVACLAAIVTELLGPTDAAVGRGAARRWTVLSDVEHAVDAANGRPAPGVAALRIRAELRQIQQQQQQQGQLAQQQLLQIGAAAAPAAATDPAAPVDRLPALAALLDRLLPASRAFPPLPRTLAVDTWSAPLAAAAVRGLFRWPLPRTSTAMLPAPPALHAAVLRTPLLRAALQAFAVFVTPNDGDSDGDGPALEVARPRYLPRANLVPPRGAARPELRAFWRAAVVTAVEDAVACATSGPALANGVSPMRQGPNVVG
ncbi:hypothetical protein HK405_008815, partial [Cladochytrium tenue]